MRLLVLGGTGFVGRHVVETALEEDHEVAVFNRGRRAPGLFGGAVEELRGDRVRGEVQALRGRSFDAVIDATAYRPSEVDSVLHALAGEVGSYAFISSVSVYADPIALGSDESAEVIELAGALPDPSDSAAAYGGLKVLCERRLPADALVVRPSVVAGPYDPTDRVTRWARRAAEGDALLAGDPAQPVQFVDARDLAAFLLHGVGSGLSGTFNVAGEPVAFSAFLDAAGAEDRVVWAGRERLRAAGVRLWDDLPMTIASEDEAFLTFSSVRVRARAAGLRTRPVGRPSLTSARGTRLGRRASATIPSRGAKPSCSRCLRRAAGNRRMLRFEAGSRTARSRPCSTSPSPRRASGSPGPAAPSPRPSGRSRATGRPACSC